MTWNRARRADEGGLEAMERLRAMRREADEAVQEPVNDVWESFGTELCSVNLAFANGPYPRAWAGDLSARLRGTGCDLAQGHPFSGPLPGDEVDDLLGVEPGQNGRVIEAREASYW